MNKNTTGFSKKSPCKSQGAVTFNIAAFAGSRMSKNTISRLILLMDANMPEQPTEKAFLC